MNKKGKNLIEILKKIVPRSVLTCARIAYTYQWLRGHSKKDVYGICIDGRSNPIPWWTYPAIDFLGTLDFSGKDVFEYGSGGSTLWWMERANFVAGVEMDENWYKTVTDRKSANVDIRLCDNGGLYPGVIRQFDRYFDVVVIDGAERYKSAQNAIEKIDPQGMIVLDNSDWYPNTAAFLRSGGYIQIDFFGFCPINSFPAVTSIYFKPECQLFNQRMVQDLNVIGGIKLKGGALDDGP